MHHDGKFTKTSGFIQRIHASATAKGRALIALRASDGGWQLAPAGPESRPVCSHRGARDAA